MILGAFTAIVAVVSAVSILATLELGSEYAVTLTTGIFALGAMSFGFAFAARWSWADNAVGGADKAYQLHRWLGYLAIAALAAHWFLDTGGDGEEGSGEAATGAFAFADLAETVAIPLAIAFFTLVFFSILRLIPYHIWKYSHYAMGPLYMIAVFHMFFIDTGMPVGSLAWSGLFVLALLGTTGWLSTLRNHFTQPANYEVISAVQNGHATDLHLKPLGRNIRHVPGQFADISINRDGLREFHPFTIAGAPEGGLRFVISPLGDFTTRMSNIVTPGDTVRVRHARGAFHPQTSESRATQVWIAGGVGITPFLSALEAMKADQGAAVELIYCIASHERAISLEELRRYEHALPQLHLTVLDASQGKKLDATLLTQVLTPLSPHTDLYLCGPEGLKNVAVSVWRAQGFTHRPHDEKFDFRAAWGSPRKMSAPRRPLTQEARNETA